MRLKNRRLILSSTDLYFSWLLARRERRQEAVIHLLEQPKKLVGSPPRELIRALKQFGIAEDEPISSLAQAWEREPLFDAIFQLFQRHRHPELRLRLARILAHLPSVHAWRQIVEIAREPYAYTIAIRLQMFEALIMLLRSKELEPTSLDELIAQQIAAPFPQLRFAVGKLILTSQCDLGRLQPLLEDKNPWLVRALQDWQKWHVEDR